MTLWWQNLMDRIDAMALRERVLVMLALLGLIALLWDILFMQPLDKARKTLTPQVAALRTDLSRINSSIEEVALQTEEDPNSKLTADLDQNRLRIAELNRQLGGLTQGMIAPEEMVEVLKQVLARTAPLQLLSLRSLPPEPLTALVPGEILPTQVYRHGVELELEGSYLDVLAFLKGMEALPWRFYWDRLDLEVSAHPLVGVKITAGTLGREEAWIGV